MALVPKRLVQGGGAAWMTCALTASALLMSPVSGSAEEMESKIARGGLLYDNWYGAGGVEKPKTANPAYPANGKYKGKDGADWRCKECHGWDYMGNQGAYGKGGHFTGIKGIQASAGAELGKIEAILKDSNHGYGMLSADDLRNLALFVAKGQVNMDQHIDRATKKVKGDKARGEAVFNTVCANCHGLDGTKDEDGKPLAADGEPLGQVASENPWEALHKIRNGQPAERMPAMRAFDLQVSLDVLAYLQTLPVKAAAQ